MSECACAHTKIKEIRWNENMGESSKFMCLDCNTDFIQVTPEIRAFLFHKAWEEKYADNPVPETYKNGLTQHYDDTMYK